MKLKSDFDLKKLEFYGFKKNWWGYKYTINQSDDNNGTLHGLYININRFIKTIEIEEVISTDNGEEYNQTFNIPDVLLELIKAGVVE